MLNRTIRRSRMIEEFFGLIPVMAKTLVWVLIAMGGYELSKHFFFPAMSILESQAITILLVTAASGVITHLVTRKQQVLKDRMELERRMRIEAEMYLYQMRKKLINPFIMQPLPAYCPVTQGVL